MSANGRQASETIERLLGRRVEDAVAHERLEAGCRAGWWRTRRNPSLREARAVVIRAFEDIEGAGASADFTPSACAYDFDFAGYSSRICTRRRSATGGREVRSSRSHGRLIQRA